MNIKILLMLVLLIFSPFNGIEAQIKQKTHAESPKKRLTMEAIKNIPEEFWKSGFVLNGCKITFPCKLIDLMQAGNYKSRAGVAMIPPTAKDEYWGTTVKNEKGEIINAVIFNPTAQALPETDCIVNSISITPQSDNWHNISDFAVFGLASKIATREEVVETVGKYCGAPAQVIDLPIIDYYDFYDKKPSETNPPHYGNIKISITISKMDSIYNERMIGFEFKHAGDFYRRQK